MEETLSKLFKAIDKYTEENDKYYIYVEYSSNNKEISLHFRDKKEHNFIITINVILIKEAIDDIEKIIEFLEDK